MKLEFAVILAAVSAVSASGCAILIGGDSPISVEARIDTPDELHLTLPEDTRRIYVQDEEFIRTVEFDPGEGAECSSDGGSTFSPCPESGRLVWEPEDYEKTFVIRTYNGGAVAAQATFKPSEELPDIEFVSCGATVSTDTDFATIGTVLGVLGASGVLCFEDGVLITDGGAGFLSIPHDGTLIARAGHSVSFLNLGAGAAFAITPASRARFVGLSVEISDGAANVFNGDAASVIELYAVTAAGAAGGGTGVAIEGSTGPVLLFHSLLTHIGNVPAIVAETLTMINSAVGDVHAGGGAGVSAGSVTMENSTISHSGNGTTGALLLTGSGSSRIVGSQITSVTDSAIFETSSGTVEISDTVLTVTDPGGLPVPSLVVFGSSTMTLDSVVFNHGSSDSVIYFDGPRTLVINDSTFRKEFDPLTGSPPAISILTDTSATLIGAGNLFCSADTVSLTTFSSVLANTAPGDVTGFPLSSQINGGAVGICP